jgi:hypothetical protein
MFWLFFFQNSIITLVPLRKKINITLLQEFFFKKIYIDFIIDLKVILGHVVIDIY